MTVEWLLNILQLVLWLRTRDFNMAANGTEECKTKSHELNWRKTQVK